MKRNDYSTVNAVMGRSSDWRDNTTHTGKAAMRLSWEFNDDVVDKALQQLKPKLLAVEGVCKVWLSKESPDGWPRKLSVKVLV